MARDVALEVGGVVRHRQPSQAREDDVRAGVAPAPRLDVEEGADHTGGHGEARLGGAKLLVVLAAAAPGFGDTGRAEKAAVERARFAAPPQRELEALERTDARIGKDGGDTAGSDAIGDELVDQVVPAAVDGRRSVRRNGCAEQREQRQQGDRACPYRRGVPRCSRRVGTSAPLDAYHHAPPRAASLSSRRLRYRSTGHRDNRQLAWATPCSAGGEPLALPENWECAFCPKAAAAG